MEIWIREAKAQVAEMEEIHANMKRAPEALERMKAIFTQFKSHADKPPSPYVSTPSHDTTERVYNKNQKELLNEYLASVPTNEVISVRKVIEFFQAHGIEGKYKSLYAYIYSMLDELVKDKTLQKEKGVGYFKPDRFHPMADE
jgi:hypothetical protein